MVLKMDAPSKPLAHYLVSEFTSALVNRKEGQEGKIIVLDRRNLGLLQKEMNFQLSGEVSDETMQAIGRKLGAQFILSGNIRSLGMECRMQVQAIEVETARISAARALTVKPGAVLVSLLRGGGKGPALERAKLFSLDRALADGAAYFMERLEGGTKLVALSFITPTPELTDFALDEFNVVMVNGMRLTVVDRRNLALLQGEMNFQLSGEVSDETMQAVGRKFGAQTVALGSLSPLGGAYYFVMEALDVETARIQGVVTRKVGLDGKLVALTRAEAGRSIGRKLAVGLGNLVLGFGSYLDGDLAGGLTVTAGYALSLGLLAWDIFFLTRDDALAGIPGAAGFAGLGLTAAYGFGRPFFYKPWKRYRPGQTVSTRIPTQQGLAVSYRWRF